MRWLAAGLMALGTVACTEAHPCFSPPYPQGCPGADGTAGDLPDLLLWFPFEGDPSEGAVDASESGLDAQCSQNCPQRTEGVEGQAFFNDGETFLTVAPGDDRLSLSALTISVFIRDDAAPDDATTNMIVGKPYLAGRNNSYRLHTRDSDEDGVRELSFRIDGETTRDQIIRLDFNDRLGVWTHVAGTWDGEEMAMYVDGELVDTLPAPTIAYDAQPLVLGGDLNSFESDNFWEGGIDEFRLYRRALSAAEVAELAR